MLLQTLCTTFSRGPSSGIFQRERLICGKTWWANKHGERKRKCHKTRLGVQFISYFRLPDLKYFACHWQAGIWNLGLSSSAYSDFKKNRNTEIDKLTVA